jgi:putative effector of murein hydrolase
MQLWIYILASIMTFVLATYLEEKHGYSRRKAVLVSVVVVWATVILITMFTFQGI